MKKILISIRPQWVAKILNGEKTIEVRKGTALYNVINRLIKEQGKAPCLIYCTKEKNKFDTLIPDEKIYIYGCPYDNFHYLKVNGKVVAEFEASAEAIHCADGCFYETDTLSANTLEVRSCLCEADFDKYLDKEQGTAILIDNLKIFDKPKELGDFIDTDTPSYEQAKPFLEMFGKPYYKETYKESCERLGYTLRRPPQSWRYVKEI